eukprot:6387516-Prymnesium_polylepis.1
MVGVSWRLREGRRDGGTVGRRDGGTAGRRDGGTAGRRPLRHSPRAQFPRGAGHYTQRGGQCAALAYRERVSCCWASSS